MLLERKSAIIGAGALAVAAGIWLLCSSALAGDRIHFSAPTGKIFLPDSRLLKPDLGRYLEQDEEIRAKSGVPTLPIVPPPSAGLNPLQNPRLREIIDQRKNWIFVTPEMVAEDLAGNESKTAQEKALYSSGTKSKKTVERYFESMNRTQESTNSLSESDTDRPARERSDVRNMFNQSLQATGGLRNVEANFNNLFGNYQPYTAKKVLARDLSANSLAPYMFESSVAQPSFSWGNWEWNRMRRDQADERIQKLLRGSEAGRPLGGLVDPISLLADTTRKPVQPVTATKLDDLDRGRDKRNLFGQMHGLPGIGLGLQPNALEDLNARALGSSSLSPAVEMPARPVFVDPKPTVLELPRRKF